MGPFEMLYGWQAVLCAIVAVGVTALVKTVLDLTMGKDERKANRWVTCLVLPLTPILTGAIYAMLVPFLPEVITTWFADNDVAAWQQLLGKAAWGGACGQFANYLYDRLKKTMGALRP